MSLLEVDALSVRYPDQRTGGSIHAVREVSFGLDAGEVLGVIGESGCGKTSLARAIVGLERPHSGTVRFEGTDLGTLRARERRRARRRLQYVFQDPYTSLNPSRTIRQALEEPLRLGGMRSSSAIDERLRTLLDQVRLPWVLIDRLPAALSGGQRQRVAIARALATDPHVLVCDEPVSALDVSIRAQIVNLFLDLREQLDLATIFIAHDLTVVREMSDRVIVMYLGTVVEDGPTAQLFDNATHPYTKALLSAVPSPDPRIERDRKRIILVGDPPSPSSPPPGCPFSSRCPDVVDLCRSVVPPTVQLQEGHVAVCHLPHQAEVVA